MKVFGVTLWGRGKSAARIEQATELVEKAGPSMSVPSTPSGASGWFGGVLEWASGFWQRGVVVDSQESILAFSPVYASITMISDDIAKLRIKLVQFVDGVWQETSSSAFSPVLRKPNSYQTRIQFLSAWVVSKLLHGNTYVLKQRDLRGVVTQLHVLDPRLVRVVVTSDGGVYYQLSQDYLSRLAGPVTVPASEIIHDRAVCLFYPLVGVSPLFACAISATQGNKIQSNSAKFFQNMSRPSGILVAPGHIDDADAARAKAEFEKNFGGENIGRLLVMGSGLKYEAMTIPAQAAQLIEQLRWTVEDVGRAFKLPAHKLSNDAGEKFNNIAAKNQDYYSQTLQKLIEDIEVLLDEGLSLPPGYGTELDLAGLLRMDPVLRAEVNEKEVKAGYRSPNEARATVDLPPVEGGDKPFLQQQNYPIDVLAKQPPPGSAPPPAAPAPPAPDPAAAKALEVITAGVQELKAAQRDADTKADARALARREAMAEADRTKAAVDAFMAKQLSLFEDISAKVEAKAPAAVEVDTGDADELAKELIAQFTMATFAEVASAP